MLSSGSVGGLGSGMGCPVDQVVAVCQIAEVHPLDPMDPSRWASA